jgi:hypothetical protein
VPLHHCAPHYYYLKRHWRHLQGLRYSTPFRVSSLGRSVIFLSHACIHKSSHSSDWLTEITCMMPLVISHHQESHVVNSLLWLVDGNHMNGTISKLASSRITCCQLLSPNWLVEITWMMPLVSLYCQKSHVFQLSPLIGWWKSHEYSISKPSLIMSWVFRLQDANMILQTSDNKWWHWWWHLEKFNPYLSYEWLCLWLFDLKLRILAVSMIFLWYRSVFR